MAPAIQDLPVYHKLIELLKDQKGVEALLNYSKHAFDQNLTEPQRSLWSMLVQHYSHKPIIGDSEDEEEESDSSNDPGSKRKRIKASPRNPCAAFTKTKSLSLPQPYRTHIEKYGSDAINFLNDKVNLIHVAPKPNWDEGDLFLACYRYTVHLEQREAKDRARWFFSMLLYFDLAKLKNPKGTGRVGSQMLTEIRSLVDGRVAIPLPLDNLSRWSKLGSKLDMFCNEFGAGCLFFLEHLLSANFLNKRFTHTGVYKDEAFAYLHKLGLSEMAEESKANELGYSIRSHLIRPFREAHFKRLPDES